MTCFLCNKCSDSQEHALSCAELRNHLDKDHIDIISSVKYDNLFGNINKQQEITKLFQTIIKTSQQLRDKMDQERAYHGQNNNGPSG